MAVEKPFNISESPKLKFVTAEKVPLLVGLVRSRTWPLNADPAKFTLLPVERLPPKLSTLLFPAKLKVPALPVPFETSPELPSTVTVSVLSRLAAFRVSVPPFASMLPLPVIAPSTVPEPNRVPLSTRPPVVAFRSPIPLRVTIFPLLIVTPAVVDVMVPPLSVRLLPIATVPALKAPPEIVSVPPVKLAKPVSVTLPADCKKMLLDEVSDAVDRLPVEFMVSFPPDRVVAPVDFVVPPDRVKRAAALCQGAGAERATGDCPDAA